ncbi:MAG: hypothetical protein AB7P50_05500 [Alphaproteobacteria bacterium]
MTREDDAARERVNAELEAAHRRMLSEQKEKYVLEGQKAFIAINGAGAVALLAFLQAIWAIPTASSIRIWVLGGILVFAIGVSLGALSYPLRHHAFVKGAHNSSHRLYRWCYWYIPAGAILLFLLGLCLPVIGALIAVL